jgi:glycosyltransferase domain-containing protein
MKKICTVIVPLKDNHQRTIDLLKHSIFDDFEYIFADGSLRDENQRLFDGIKASNIRYFRFAYDNSIKNFYKKMSKSSQLVETDFVVNLDQGDFILKDGVLRACKLMQSNLDLSSVGGPLFFARHIHGYMTRPYPSNQTIEISYKNLELALNTIKKNYTYIWYVVHRTDVFSEIWADIFKYRFPHPFSEYYPTIKSLSKGKHGFVDAPLMIRTVYGPSSWTKHPSDFVADETHNSADELLYSFAKICQDENGIDKDLVYQAFLKNYHKIVFPLENSTNYGLEKIGLKKLVSISTKIGLSRHTLRIIAHFSKLIFPASSSDRFFSALTWKKVSVQIDRLNRVSSN